MRNLNSFLNTKWGYSFQVIFFLAISSNVFLQFCQRSSISDYHNWDSHHAAFMGSSTEAFGSEVAVDAFQTYGPLYKLIIGSVSPFQSNWNYYYILFWMAIWLTIFFLFLRSCQISNPFLWTAIILGGFNFPSLSYASWPIILWSLTSPKFKQEKFLHYLSGVLYVSALLMFKFSYGFIALFQVLLWSITIPKSAQNKIIEFLKMFSLICLCTISIYLFSSHGDLRTLIDYISISFSDASSYASLMMSPLDHMNGLIVFLWPLFLLILVALTAGIKTGQSRFWLPLMLLPVSYAEFKHSYTRCDYTNLKGTFFVTGVLCYCLLIRYYNHKKFRYGTIFVLLIFIICSYAGALPLNVPWRHPRFFWIKTPQQDYLDWKIAKQESEMALQHYLSEFAWIKNKVQHDSLAVSPAALCLTLLSPQPHILKAAQSYYNLPMNEKLDIASMDELKSDWLIFENWIIDQRLPASHEPEFFKKFITEYDYVENYSDRYLLKRRLTPKSWIHVSKEHISIENGFSDSPLNSIRENQALFIQSNDLGGWLYPIQKFLLRGERLILNIGSKEYVISLLELKHGVLIIPKLESFYKNSKVALEGNIKLLGPVSRKCISDPVNLLPNLNLNGMLSIEVLELNE